MKRLLSPYISRDLEKKIVLLMGPRQSGKTVLAKSLHPTYDYLNFDDEEHRILIKDKSWDRAKPLLILDELHKKPKWKQWLKGLYDSEEQGPKILVTGSAQLDAYKKVGDSLAGRFFSFRLHPLDLKEIALELKPADLSKSMERLLTVGGFPEPYLEENPEFYGRWKKTHQDIILKQDLMNVERVQEIMKIETLIQLLRKRVASPISYASLANDLDCDDKTVKRWLGILENLYVVFKITPFHRNITRSLKKAPKYYFYDTGQVSGDAGIKLENLIACALLKEIHFREDTRGETWNLHYIRTRAGNEIDFLLVRDNEPMIALEAKHADPSPSRHFHLLHKKMEGIPKVQLVKDLKRETTYPGKIEVRRAAEWLAAMPLPK